MSVTPPRTSRDVEFFYVAGMCTAGTRPHLAREEFDQWRAADVAATKAAALREFAGLIGEILALGPRNTGLRTPEQVREYAYRRADRIEEGQE